MDTKERLRLPQQHSGHHDRLEQLAAILSAEAEARRATRTVVRAGAADLAPTILPTRRTHRGRRAVAAVLLAMSAIAVAMLTRSVVQTAASAPVRSAPPAGTQAPAAASSGASTPVAWGEAARARLSAGGRPVSVFGCVGAYDIDAPRSSGLLPIAGQGTIEYADYLRACVSDMSGQPVTPNEVAPQH